MQKLLLLSTLILSVAQFGILFAQSNLAPAVTKPISVSFDAVSIRQIDKIHTVPTGDGLVTLTTANKQCQYLPDRVVCQLPLKRLIEEAFQLRKVDMAGFPKMGDDLFAFQATMPVGTDKDTARLMLQKALIERFGLQFHREKRVVSVYALVPGKRGVNLHPADDWAHRKLLNVKNPVTGHGALVSMSPGQFSAVAISLDLLADDLNLMAGVNLPVINMTGLTGEYKVDLHWTPAEESTTSLTILDSGFMGAVQNQLGLKLEKRELSADVFVVDHVEHLPTDN
jgi:uncharacterized protein (TIGR03435 family)